MIELDSNQTKKVIVDGSNPIFKKTDFMKWT